MKKKMIRVAMSALLLLPVIFGLVGGGLAGQANESDNDKVTVKLHKKKMANLPASLIQNTGVEVPELAEYAGLPGIEFSVYNVTADYLAKLEEDKADPEKSAENRHERIIAALKLHEPTSEAIATNRTNATGDSDFSLPKTTTIEGKAYDSVYLFVENSLTANSENLVLVLPAYEITGVFDNKISYGETELATIHLYPKNVVSDSGKVAVEKRKTGDNLPLAGATFNLLKTDGGTTLVLTGEHEGVYTWQVPAEGVIPYAFESGQAYSIDAREIKVEALTATATGTKNLTIDHLPNGSFTLKEVSAPTNAAKINDYLETKFTIVEGNTTFVDTPETGEAGVILNDTLVVEKTVRETAYEIGQEIDYEISFTIPEGIQDLLADGTTYRYNQVVLTDSHSQHLSYLADSGRLQFATTEISPENYSFNLEENGFTVTLNNAAIRLLVAKETLTFSYKMKLVATANADEDFNNKIVVEVGGLTDEDNQKVTTGGKKFTKIDQNSKDPLAGVTFYIKNSEDKYLLQENGTTSWLDMPVNAEDPEGILPTMFTSDEAGNFEVSGLAYGNYYLEEVTALEDYVKITSPIEFVVAKDSYGKTNPLKVENRHKGFLPATGGTGIIGLILFGVLAWGIAIKHFRKAEKEV